MLTFDMCAPRPPASRPLELVVRLRADAIQARDRLTPGDPRGPGRSRIGRLRRGPRRLRDVLEVDAHARPGGEAPAHRVDEDVPGSSRAAARGGAPSSARGRRARPPSAAARAIDEERRAARGAGAPRRRDGCTRGGSSASSRSAAATARRPARRLAAAPTARAAARASRPRSSIPASASPTPAKRAGTVRSVKSPGSQAASSSQVTGAETRASGVGRTEYADADRAVLGVLVVVEEDAVPLLLPPLAGRERGRAPLDLARERERRRGAPRRSSSAARSARTRGCRASPRSSASRRARVAEHLARPRAPPRGSAPTRRRHRVEVDAQLVGVLEIAGADRVRVQVDAAEVHHPGELRGVADHDLLGGAARGEAQLHHLDPRRPRRGRALLVEELALGPVDVALQRHRAIAHAAQRAVGDGEVVADELELRDPGLGKYSLSGFEIVTSRPPTSRNSFLRVATGIT